VLDRLKYVQQMLWSIDALLFVMAYTALLLLIPTPSPRWHEDARHSDPNRTLS
jgi:hypothetical protein